MRTYYPEAVLFCVDGPMVSNYYPEGASHLTKLRNYIAAAREKLDPAGRNKTYTFSMTTQQEGDYGCDWHPNLKRHEKMSEELSKFIKTTMRW